MPSPPYVSSVTFEAAALIPSRVPLFSNPLPDESSSHVRPDIPVVYISWASVANSICSLLVKHVEIVQAYSLGSLKSKPREFCSSLSFVSSASSSVNDSSSFNPMSYCLCRRVQERTRGPNSPICLSWPSSAANIFCADGNVH